MNRYILLIITLLTCFVAQAKDHEGIVSTELSSNRFTLIENGKPVSILIADSELKGIRIAAENLQADFERVSGTKAQLATKPTNGGNCIIVGTLQSPYIQQIIKKTKGQIPSANASTKGESWDGALKGKAEKYIMTVVESPVEGVSSALVIAGSDMRGTIYGIYELSEQIGVSPWYDWMDVPVVRQQNLSIAKGTYTAGEPAVRYRGIFLNDEAPCLTTWVKNTYGTGYGDHRFYARVFELVLRLRGNYMWPAMWGWAFYADDPLNLQTANEMGIIMGTSHHEPMARNHQEWARHRKEYGEWNYETNQKVIDQFFREGIRRTKDTEDIITIGMRGDGDTAMGGKEGHDDENMSGDEHNKHIINLLEKICNNQRKIIAEETGKPANKRQQVWALYKEVQLYYDLGLKVPEDAIILLCDDNWGDIRRLPTEAERKHKGGFGMYYHVDYVGAPRNSKWLNVSPIQHIWDQLTLTYQYGVDKLWILNVGDLKPMEYPITLFMNMAWNPTKYNVDNLLDHPRQFCAQQFGEAQADEAARILNLCCQYAGRSTAEMLDARTYNLESGEWAKVVNQYLQLEAEALRQYITLPAEYRNAYQQLILFPVQAMGNIHQMYYAQAMNRKLFAENNPDANLWADRVEACFKRDAELCRAYNKDMANGKWDGMMIQKHIGYTQWNDNFPADVCPKVERIADVSNSKLLGGYTFQSDNRGYIAIEAEHYYSTQNPKSADAKHPNEGAWTVIPFRSRTRSAMAIQPYTASTEGSSITYRMEIPAGVTEADVHIITASTLPFKRFDGHRYTVAFEGTDTASSPADAIEINFNGELNEAPENVYRITYPTVARRVVEKKVRLKTGGSGTHNLVIRPLDPGVELQKIVVDFGGYKPQHLFGEESNCKR